MIRALSRRSFTEHQQSATWSLWSQGKSLSEIGRQLNKHAAPFFVSCKNMVVSNRLNQFVQNGH